MSDSIQPLNVVGAAMIAQLSVISIMAAGAVFVRRSDREARLRGGPTFAPHVWMILLLAIVTMGSLGTSDAFSSTWSPLLGEAVSPVLRWSAALSLVFLLDIIAVTVLVVGTSGEKYSPFVALFFLLPTLAVFLREPTTYVLIYLLLVIICYSGSMLPFPEPDVREFTTKWRLGQWFVSVASVVLAVLVGLLTRPT